MCGGCGRGAAWEELNVREWSRGQAESKLAGTGQNAFAYHTSTTFDSMLKRRNHNGHHRLFCAILLRDNGLV